MAWKTSPKTTQHTCGGPVFGRKTAGCPRCDELLAGAEAIVWGGSAHKCLTCGTRIGYFGSCDSCNTRAHFASADHNSEGHYCTWGD